MNNVLAGGVSFMMLFIGHVQAGEIVCPVASELHRNVESLEDVYFVDALENREWKSESLVAVVDPLSLKFEGAEYELHEAAPSSSATITCKYGQINLKRDHPQVLEPSYSLWSDNRCKSASTQACRLMDAEYFNVSY
ncbi:DUF3757 domain-containing protein [Pseudomonas sp. SMN5]|uniref:DUF3757 domain-containing protein n=1 Tax=Pseudomonas sp. SMN5 TaxID=3390198 RepID=UPI003F855822